MCVSSKGQTFATEGLLAHIGSHFTGFFAGLHSVVRAMREKMPKRRGHRVILLGLMVVREITEFSVTTKSMKERCKQLCTVK